MQETDGAQISPSNPAAGMPRTMHLFNPAPADRTYFLLSYTPPRA